MSVIFHCDGCGKTAPGVFNRQNWTKPTVWFARNAKDHKSEVHACSRQCVDAADKARGERVAIIPI